MGVCLCFCRFSKAQFERVSSKVELVNVAQIRSTFLNAMAQGRTGPKWATTMLTHEDVVDICVTRGSSALSLPMVTYWLFFACDWSFCQRPHVSQERYVARGAKQSPIPRGIGGLLVPLPTPVAFTAAFLVQFSFCTARFWRLP